MPVLFGPSLGTWCPEASLDPVNPQAAVALIGPRQVGKTGKTTLAHAIAEGTDTLYLDLEAAADRNKLGDPRSFLATTTTARHPR